MRSSVYARTLVAFYELLAGAAWPGERPMVAIGNFTENEHGTTDPAEGVLVLTSAPTDSQQNWASMTKDRQEEFTITVECVTTLPGRSLRETLERLEELTGTVEDVTRETADPELAGLLSGVRMSWEVASVEPWLGPRAQGDGFDAACTLSIRVRARI